MRLELADVSCGYEKGKPITEGVSLSLEEGRICCILGPNGVGKSTLFKTILNLIKPLSGKVLVDGEDISGFSAKRMARIFAYVEQAHTAVYSYSVLEMVMMGRLGHIGLLGQPAKEDYEAVEKALATVEISHLKNKKYTEISGGERQLMLIARALAQEPECLVMDEPTANLDYGNMVRVMECINELSESGLTVIFTSHMPDQAYMCDAMTALMFRNRPLIFGPAAKVVIEKNLHEAYHADIQVLEIIGEGGVPVRVVAPRFKHNKKQEG